METLERLRGIADVFLPDFKYADNALARKYSNCSDYFEVCSQAIAKMRELQPIDVFDNGIMQKGMIIRHLVLPNSLENTKKVLDNMSVTVSCDAYVSLMGQYVPFGRSLEYPELARPLLPLEYKIAVSYAEKAGFSNAFVQDLSSASQEYIPDFDESPIEV